MVDWQMKIINVEADRLIELAVDDAGLRAELRSLAEKILSATAVPRTKNDTAPANSSVPACRGFDGQGEPDSHRRPGGSAPAGRTAPGTDAGTIVPSRSPVKPIATKVSGAGGSRGRTRSEIEARCRKKADAARWAAAHERWLQQGADLDDEGHRRTRRSPDGPTH